jgi:hypothetical protein
MKSSSRESPRGEENTKNRAAAATADTGSTAAASTRAAAHGPAATSSSAPDSAREVASTAHKRLRSPHWADEGRMFPASHAPLPPPAPPVHHHYYHAHHPGAVMIMPPPPPPFYVAAAAAASPARPATVLSTTSFRTPVARGRSHAAPGSSAASSRRRPRPLDDEEDEGDYEYDDEERGMSAAAPSTVGSATPVGGAYKTRSWEEIQLEQAKHADGVMFPPDFPRGPFSNRDAAYAALKAWASALDNSVGGAFAVSREAYWPASNQHSRKGPRQLFRCNRYGSKRKSPKQPERAPTPDHAHTIKCNCPWAVYYEESTVGWVASNYSEATIKARGQHNHALYQTVAEKNTNPALRHLSESLGITAELLRDRCGQTMPQIYDFLVDHCHKSGMEANFTQIDIKNRFARVKRRQSNEEGNVSTTVPRPASATRRTPAAHEPLPLVEKRHDDPLAAAANESSPDSILSNQSISRLTGSSIESGVAGLPDGEEPFLSRPFHEVDDDLINHDLMWPPPPYDEFDAHNNAPSSSPPS